MDPLGVEPRFQEPESYVRSITLRVHTTVISISKNYQKLKPFRLSFFNFKKRKFFLEFEKIHCYTNSVDWEMCIELKSSKLRFSYIFKQAGTVNDTHMVTERPTERRGL